VLATYVLLLYGLNSKAIGKLPTFLVPANVLFMPLIAEMELETTFATYVLLLYGLNSKAIG
jgi:hypothetical protein